MMTDPTSSKRLLGGRIFLSSGRKSSKEPLLYYKKV